MNVIGSVDFSLVDFSITREIDSLSGSPWCVVGVVLFCNIDLQISCKLFLRTQLEIMSSVWSERKNLDNKLFSISNSVISSSVTSSVLCRLSISIGKKHSGPFFLSSQYKNLGISIVAPYRVPGVDDVPKRL